MAHTLGPNFVKDFSDPHLVSNIDLKQRDVVGQIPAGARLQIVYHEGSVSPLQQRINDMATDEACPAGNDHFHLNSSPFQTSQCPNSTGDSSRW